MVMTVFHKVNMIFSFKFSTKDLVLTRLPHEHSKLRKFITLSKQDIVKKIFVENAFNDQKLK